MVINVMMCPKSPVGLLKLQYKSCNLGPMSPYVDNLLQLQKWFLMLPLKYYPKV